MRESAPCFVKYDTVIGIIGKTHGVSSERAPIVIASHINPQIGWSLISPSPVRTTGAAFEFVERMSACAAAILEFKSSLVFEFTDEFTLEFTFARGVGDCDGLGETLGLGVGEAAVPAAVIVSAAVRGTVFGGRQTV